MAQQGGAAKVTTDHDKIRKWVEKRGGCPATVKRTSRGGEPGVIRIDYPGFSGQQSLKQISWDEFFDKFEKNNLAFIYQEKTPTGRPSRFSKLVRRDSAAARPGRAAARTRRTPDASESRRTSSSGTSTSTSTKRKTAAGSARSKTQGAKTGRRSTGTAASSSRSKRGG